MDKVGESLWTLLSLSFFFLSSPWLACKFVIYHFIVAFVPCFFFFSLPFSPLRHPLHCITFNSQYMHALINQFPDPVPPALRLYPVESERQTNSS